MSEQSAVDRSYTAVGPLDCIAEVLESPLDAVAVVDNSLGNPESHWADAQRRRSGEMMA